MASSAANRPSDNTGYQGETRTGYGYEFWTTSEEDEEAIATKELIDSAEGAPKKAVPKRKKLKPGTMRRLGIRVASLLLIGILAAGAWFVFNLTRVYSAAEDVTTAPAHAIVVLGAAQYNGEPSGVLRERLDHAFALRADESLWIDGKPPVIMTTGAGQEGEVDTEGLAGYNYLIGLLGEGESESDILAIPEGTNTYEQLSASLFQLELLDAAAPDRSGDTSEDGSEEGGLTSVILVSDGYHNARLLKIADELGMRSDDRSVFLSPQQIIDPTTMNHVREAAAMSIGRITGFRRLSAFTESG